MTFFRSLSAAVSSETNLEQNILPLKDIAPFESRIDRLFECCWVALLWLFAGSLAVQSTRRPAPHCAAVFPEATHDRLLSSSFKNDFSQVSADSVLGAAPVPHLHLRREPQKAANIAMDFVGCLPLTPD
jgi:hypothetical protein